MADLGSSISFSDFPEDVQLCILSFLSPSDLTSFACTSKLSASLFRSDSKLWFALCDRRWGSRTNIRKWGNGRVGFMLLYRILAEYDNLIGFWRRIGGTNRNAAVSDSPSPPHPCLSKLVFFEWGPSFVTGSMVSPSKSGGYGVVKSPFIWMSLSPDGEALTYLDPGYRIRLTEEPESPSSKDLVHVTVSFIGKGHVFVEECKGVGFRGGNSSCNLSNSASPEATGRGGSAFSRSGFEEMENLGGTEIGSSSPPDRMMSEMYQYFANRTSPGSGGDRAWRRQRRREKERRGKRRWDSEHLVKIVSCSPSPSRPLQGLWKGITEDMSLEFFLVTYDELGGIACRRVGDSSVPFCDGPPVFWTSDATFSGSPITPEEELLYTTRLHVRPVEIVTEEATRETVSRIMYIMNSSYDLVIPDMNGAYANPGHVEGRIWLYSDGTYGFGFLRNHFIVDLKHIAQDGHILDISEVEV